jgi:hypothetical protein
MHDRPSRTGSPTTGRQSRSSWGTQGEDGFHPFKYTHNQAFGQPNGSQSQVEVLHVVWYNEKVNVLVTDVPWDVVVALARRTGPMPCWVVRGLA